MALSIKLPEADRLARRLANATGETITIAVLVALRNRMEQVERKRQNSPNLAAKLMAIGRHCSSLPVLDPRTSDEILGYDDNGLPS